MHNRLKQVTFSLELVQNFIIQGAKWGDGEILECIEGIPEGCYLVDAWCDRFNSTMTMVLQHESFDPIPEGSKPPDINPIMKRTIKDHA